jgi:hypothetical protein
MRHTPKQVQLPVAQGIGAWLDHLGRPVARPQTPAADARSDEVALEALDEAMRFADASRISAEIIDWHVRGRRTDTLAGVLGAWVANRPGGMLDPAWLALTDALRAASEFDPSRVALPWLVAATLIAERLGGRPLLPAVRAAGEGTQAELAGHVANRRAEAAEASVAAALAAGRPVAAMERNLLELAAAHPGDGGVTVVAAVRLADLRAAAGDAAIAAILPRFARALAERPEQLAYTQQHPARVAAVEARFAAMAAAENPDKGKAFAEPKFRPHVLDGKGDAPYRASVKALEFGVPHEILAQSLSLAASERLLRFDPRWQRDETVAEDGADAMQLLLLTSAVRRLRVDLPAASWLPLYLFAVGLVHATAPLDASERDRVALPEPAQLHQTWDHGPEIAKIVAALHKHDGERAIAVLRAYFLLALPEQPLCAQLLEAALSDLAPFAVDAARAIALMTAAVDEFQALVAHPHRETPLCAALRSLSAPPTHRRTAALGSAALDARMGAMPPQHLVEAGPVLG